MNRVSRVGQSCRARATVFKYPDLPRRENVRLGTKDGRELLDPERGTKQSQYRETYFLSLPMGHQTVRNQASGEEIGDEQRRADLNLKGSTISQEARRL
jgi:hypothetical protein